MKMTFYAVACLLFAVHSVECFAPLAILAENDWYLAEDTALGEKVGQVRLADPGKRLNLYIGGPLLLPKSSRVLNGSEYFRIEAETGKVFLDKSLSGLQGTRLMFSVNVYDGPIKASKDIAVHVASSVGLHMPPGIATGIRPPQIPVRLPPPPRPPPTTSSSSISSLVVEEVTEAPVIAKNEDVTAIGTVAIPAAVAVVIVTLCLLGFFVVRRKRLTAVDSPPPEKENPETKRRSSSVTNETLSLQHWTSKKAVSNRYESWNIGEIDQSWRNKNSTEDGWEFPRHRLRVISILGEGCFGQVWKCQAQNIASVEGSSFVAVKTLKESAGDKEREELLKELQVMKSLKPHPNIVTLLGCCTDKDPVFVIMEYINGGILQSFLRKSRAEDHHYGNLHGASKQLTARDLTSFAYQVARAMDYLTNKGIIHRDLAARNVLITDERVCKVADFGFARDIIGNQIYQRKSEGRLPIRWMAPESLYDNLFSSKTDVWSFGILLWEIVTLGSTPYPGMAATEVMQRVREGYRLEKPEHCKREVYNVMFYCWEKDPNQRPTFGELVQLLEQLLMSETDYIELALFPDHSYYNMVPPSDEKV